jgi:hypothetical protein
MTVIVDVRNGEEDILIGFAHYPLNITDAETGTVITTIHSNKLWDYESLSKATDDVNVNAPNGADYFLGPQWVGGTEV